MRDLRRRPVALSLCALALALAACTAPPPRVPEAVPGPGLLPTQLEQTDNRPTLWVAVDGDDTAPGTRDEPLRTIGRAAALAKPGTVVRVEEGTYEGAVTTATSGTADAPITYLSEPEGAAEVVGTGGGEGSAWHNLGDHVEIVGFTISGDTLDGLLSEGSFVRIIGNHVSDFRGTCIVTQRTGYQLHDIDVIGNVAAECGTTPLDHGIYVSHPGGTVANNISFGNAGFGIHCWHNCNRLVISHNLVFDNIEGGILIGQGDGPNNGAVAADGFVVSNNIAIDNGNYGFEESGTTGSNIRYLNNSVFGNVAGPFSLQTGTEAGTVTTSPQFVDFRMDGSGDYRLRPTSPMIDAGTYEGAVSTDFSGTTRPQGSAVDIGVYEH